VKGWLARAAASTARHGPARSGVRRWIRWLPDHADPVDPRFQGADEPYPRHWRSGPAPWPAGFTADPAIRERLDRAVRSLPPLWRAVLLARDADRRPGEQVAADLGISVAQQRRVLNRARAAVRDELAGRHEPRGTR
jgi:DNA-directed RNA polymerase specialized sigma24 family protein